ncbi:hypothetical protein CPB84DRAFT_302751 [Gymnopilus junonius]|uniref:Methyltransferase domain-containing protein n=1 Tax=Gymnopilus junonius TaxID=109634 RepID=A0A9P5TQT6_GYMJU|nr:hypothetical protein CPB84DRAFT_302751 [Gymnopilus junonius]
MNTDSDGPSDKLARGCENYVSSYTVTLGYKLFLKDLALFVRRQDRSPINRECPFENVPVITTTKRRCRRRPGEVPYPVQYCNQMADFDIWDHMFLTGHFRSLTTHQFSTPPPVVLDLGCGTGYWVIEAAKQWTNSKFYGFDVAKIQPRLQEMHYYKALARRIEWLHGNFLDGLPFESDYFDFVRIAGLGLAIPEDEWQTLLEEVHRVMRPGAVLEIIEEDLLFPCPSALLQSSQSSSPSTPIDQPGSFELHKSKSITFFDRPSKSPERKPLLSTLGSVYQRARLTSRASMLPPPVSVAEQSSTSTSTLITSTDTMPGIEHPQDHTRLKAAWDALLDTRFLSPNLLSVLPFYLTSSGFEETKVQSPLVVTLPPNSGNVPTLKTYRSMGSMRVKPEHSLADTLFDFSPALLSSSANYKTDGFVFWSSVFSINQPSTQGRGSMHLAKTVSTIKGCKEAIWEEHKKLYWNDALYILSRTAPGEEEDYKTQPYRHVVRKAFEVDWRNWELDMIDRMDSDGPDWRNWRDKLVRKSGSEDNSGHLITGFNPDDLCRSLRVFTGTKP